MAVEGRFPEGASHPAGAQSQACGLQHHLLETVSCAQSRVVVGTGRYQEVCFRSGNHSVGFGVEYAAGVDVAEQDGYVATERRVCLRCEALKVFAERG